MGYVEELRSIIGHRRIILNGCIALIRNPAGQILMQQRKYPHGTWGLPGGLMELGESAEETVRREVFEETGLTLGEVTLFGVYSGKGYLCVAQNGDEYYVVTIAYATSDYHGEVCVNDDESLTFEWMDLDRLPEAVAKTHRVIIDDYIARIAS